MSPTRPTGPTPSGEDLGSRARALIDRALQVYADSPRATGWLRAHAERMDSPLRLAVAGKVKAGKSTLLNALVGEEVAATDAGECTRVVTWYRDGPTPRVTLHPRSGPARALPVRAGPDGRGLAIDLGGAAPEGVERLTVDWPSSGLRATALIDTPGIASLSRDTAARAGAFLTPVEGPTEVDAVLYLMRHLHSADARFLESFHDREIARATPVSTVAVLSRADEIGAGRDDAMESARRIAQRYRTDDRLSTVCRSVVAVAGLLALAGRTLRSDETAALAALARMDDADTEVLLRSVDRFVTPPDSVRDRLPAGDGPDAAARAALLDRLGLFGVRVALGVLRRDGPGPADGARLAAALVTASGLDELRDVLTAQFTARRTVLKARSALLAVDAVARSEPRPAARALITETERIIAGAHEFAELRLLAALRARSVSLPDGHHEEAERLLGGHGADLPARLGLAPDDARCREAAVETLVRWQRRAASPMATRAAADAATVVVRSCEGMLAALARR